MKEIKFKSVDINNFLSIGEIHIDFRPGINIIHGLNKDTNSKNACGKSAIKDSIFFGIFGRPLRNIKKDNLISWKFKSGCKVSLVFDVIENNIKSEYQIIRTLEPSKVWLYKNGEEITRTIQDTTKYIIQLIGSNDELFEQCIIMDSNSTNSFLSQKAVAKRKFIENIFKLSIFSEMLSLIRHDFNDTTKVFDIEKAKSTEVEKSLVHYKRQEELTKINKTKNIKELQERHQKNNREIEDLTKQIVEITDEDIVKLKSDIQSITEKEATCNQKIRFILQKTADTKSNIKLLKEKINDILKLPKDLCKSCKRPFTNEDLSVRDREIQILKDKIIPLDNELVGNTEVLKKLEEAKDSCKIIIAQRQEKIHSIDLKISNNKNIKNKIKKCYEIIEQIQKDIKKIEEEQNSFENVIKETEDRLLTLQNELKNLNDKLKIIENSKMIISEEGVKSVIIKKLLKILNTRMNFYLQKFEANCICKFNEYFEEEILNVKSQSCSYYNFSNGERKRIDLAMLFTFLDMRRFQSNISINLSVYDELLDSSLDDKGIENVLEILKERAEQYNECIYIISHKKESLKHVTGEIIYLEKENGETKRVDLKKD